MLKKLVNYVGIAAALAVPLVFVSAQAVEAKTCEFKFTSCTENGCPDFKRNDKVAPFFNDPVNWGASCKTGDAFNVPQQNDIAVINEDVILSAENISRILNDGGSAKDQMVNFNKSGKNYAYLGKLIINKDGRFIDGFNNPWVTVKADGLVVINETQINGGQLFFKETPVQLVGPLTFDKGTFYAERVQFLRDLIVQGYTNSDVKFVKLEVGNGNTSLNVKLTNNLSRISNSLKINTLSLENESHADNEVALSGSGVLSIDNVILNSYGRGKRTLTFSPGLVVSPIKSINLVGKDSRVFNKTNLKIGSVSFDKGGMLDSTNGNLSFDGLIDLTGSSQASLPVKDLIITGKTTEISSRDAGKSVVVNGNFIVNLGASLKLDGVKLVVNGAFVNNGSVILVNGASIVYRTPEVAFTYVKGNPINTELKTPDTLYVTVKDRTANLDGTIIDAVQAYVYASTLNKNKPRVQKVPSNSANDKETVTLYETGADTGVFRNQQGFTVGLTPSGEKFVAENGVLEISEDSNVSAKYGNPARVGEKEYADTLVVRATKVDLIPAGITVNDPPKAPGQNGIIPRAAAVYEIKFGVKNSGNASSKAFSSGVVLSGTGGTETVSVSEAYGVSSGQTKTYSAIVYDSVMNRIKSLDQIKIVVDNKSEIYEWDEKNNEASIFVGADLAFAETKDSSPIKIVNSNLNSFTVEYNMVNKGALPTGQFKIKHVVHGTDGAKKKTYEYTYTGLKGNQTEEFSFAIPKKDLAELKNLTELQVMLDSGTEVPEGDENNNITELKLFRKMQIGEASAEVKLDQFLFPSAYTISVPVSNSGNVPAGPFEVVATVQLKFHNTDDDTYSDYPPAEYKVTEKVGLTPGKTENYEINVPTGRNDELVSVSVEVRSLSQIADDAEPDQN